MCSLVSKTLDLMTTCSLPRTFHVFVCVSYVSGCFKQEVRSGHDSDLKSEPRCFPPPLLLHLRRGKHVLESGLKLNESHVDLLQIKEALKSVNGSSSLKKFLRNRKRARRLWSRVLLRFLLFVSHRYSPVTISH